MIDCTPRDMVKKRGTLSHTAQRQTRKQRQDAFRRDFTINALFYNLGTRQVEDFTGQVRKPTC